MALFVVPNHLCFHLEHWWLIVLTAHSGLSKIILPGWWPLYSTAKPFAKIRAWVSLRQLFSLPPIVPFPPVLVRGSIAMKRHHDNSNSLYFIGWLTVQGSSPLSSWWDIGAYRQPCCSRELRGLHLDMQATGRELRHWVWLNHTWDPKAHL